MSIYNTLYMVNSKWKPWKKSATNSLFLGWWWIMMGRATWPRVFWNTWCNSACVWFCYTKVWNRNSSGYLRPQLGSSLHNKDTTQVQPALTPLVHPFHTQTLNTSSSSTLLSSPSTFLLYRFSNKTLLCLAWITVVNGTLIYLCEQNYIYIV